MNFIQLHYQVGELYMQFIREGCVDAGESEVCEYCSAGRTGKRLKRIPRPYPDTSGHYKDVFETPNEDRAIDDFQPRAAIKKLYANGVLDTEEQIKAFSDKYMISIELVKQYMHHIWRLKIMKNLRTKDRQDAKSKNDQRNYEEYNWEELFLTGKLDKLIVNDLNKYLDHHGINKSKKLRKEKLAMIKYHLSQENNEKLNVTKITGKQIVNSMGHDEDESLSDDGEVIDSTIEFSSGSEQETEPESGAISDEPSGIQHTTTRSGRRATRFVLK